MNTIIVMISLVSTLSAAPVAPKAPHNQVTVRQLVQGYGMVKTFENVKDMGK